MDQSAQKDTTFAPASAGQSPPSPTPGTGGQTAQNQKPTSQQPPVNKLPLILVAIVAVLLLVVLLIVGVVNQKKVIPQPQPTIVPNADKLPEENIASTRGQVLAVDPQGKKITLRSLNPRVNGEFVTWTMTTTDDTILARSSDWAEASSGESTLGAGLPKMFPEIKAQVKRIEITDFKVGDIVYIIVKQGQNLATQTDIEGPSALLLE